MLYKLTGRKSNRRDVKKGTTNILQS